MLPTFVFTIHKLCFDHRPESQEIIATTLPFSVIVLIIFFRLNFVRGHTLEQTRPHNYSICPFELYEEKGRERSRRKKQCKLISSCYRFIVFLYFLSVCVCILFVLRIMRIWVVRERGNPQQVKDEIYLSQRYYITF